MNTLDWTDRIRNMRIPDAHLLSKDLQAVRRAAILLPLLQKEDGWHLLFEVRAYDLDVQPGDVCFPGGGLEAGEDALSAVLREAEEELLIDRTQIEILHTLPDVIGPACTVVTPFAGILSDYRGTFFPGETDRVFSVPLSWFLSHPPRIYRSHDASYVPDDFPFDLIYGGRNYPFSYADSATFFYEHPEATIWGFTAKVVALFFACLNPDQTDLCT